MLNPDLGVLLITHYQRLLNYIKPDRVHVLARGRIITSGGSELALELEENGYAPILRAAGFDADESDSALRDPRPRDGGGRLTAASAGSDGMTDLAVPTRGRGAACARRPAARGAARARPARAPRRLPDPRPERPHGQAARLPRLGRHEPEAAARSSRRWTPTTASTTRTSTAASTRSASGRPPPTRAPASRSPASSTRPSGARDRAGRATPPRRSTSSPTAGAAGNLGQGDAIVLTEMEHHANLVPWQILAQEVDGDLEFIPITDDGILRLDVFEVLLRLHPKLVAFTHVSNTLGHHQPGPRDGRDGPRGGRARARRRRAGRAAPAGRRRRSSAPTSTSSPATRCSARPAPASCGPAASCSTRCRRSSPAAT